MTTLRSMFSAALIGLAAVSSTVPDPDPVMIGPAVVDLYTSTAEAQPLCDAYGALVDLIGTIDGDGAGPLLDAADAFIIVRVEGDTMRLNNEARETLVDWLHTDCTV